MFVCGGWASFVDLPHTIKIAGRRGTSIAFIPFKLKPNDTLRNYQPEAKVWFSSLACYLRIFFKVSCPQA